MTRRKRKIFSRTVSVLITIAIIVVLSLYTSKTLADYKLDKDDEKLALELEELFKNDVTLYEEVLPEEEPENGSTVIVLPPTNQDLLTANLSYIGIIEIPKLGIRKPIVKGTTRKDIANKVGWDTTTAMPGHEGNSILAAHNAANFFLYIYRLEPGDTFSITTREGTFTYKVWKTFKVHKTEVWVFDTIKEHPNMVTLITCNKPDANYRWIVRGDLISSPDTEKTE